jgi:hypothetical protein
MSLTDLILRLTVIAQERMCCTSYEEMVIAAKAAVRAWLAMN